MNKNLKNNKPKIAFELDITDVDVNINFKQISIIMKFAKYINKKQVYDEAIIKHYYLDQMKKEDEKDYIQIYKQYYKVKYNPKYKNEKELVKLTSNLIGREAFITYNAIYYLRFHASIEYGFESRIEAAEDKIKAIKDKWKITCK